jgi:hypothetical protein
MIRKKIINPERVRRINGSFSFIPHRFLTDGFLTLLTQQEILLYIFLVLASDRYGLSYYAYDSICSYLQLAIDDYIEARDGLVEKDLIACNGTLFQVLDLPAKPANQPIRKAKNSSVAQLIEKSLKEDDND